MISNEEKNWAMLCHLSALLGFDLVPSANVWAPLILWILKKGDSPFVDDQGKESLNFHITWWIWVGVATIMWFTIVLIPLAILLFVFTYLAGFICTIVAALAAANGRHYRYPFTLRFLK